MQRTKIPYLTHTWNPFAMRCTPCSPGCANCWHLKLCARFKNNPIFLPEVRAAYAGGKLVLLKDELEAPLRKKKPAVIGVQFMGDLFHEDIDIEMLSHIFDTMNQCPQHDFVILTKRLDNALRMMWGKHNGGWRYFGENDFHKNIIFGGSCSTQEDLDKNVPVLLRIPAAKRIISIEPLLEEIDLGNSFYSHLMNIDWVVVGCESGPKRRPCKIEWVRSIVKQCKAAGVKVFVKQLNINGKVSHNPAEWPEDLRIQEMIK
jgi:protein gp37